MRTTQFEAEARAESRIFNRIMMRFTGLLGLTPGIGVVAWGATSLIMTIGMSIYERTGLKLEEIVIEDSLNQGMLQSAMLIALGAVILELRRISQALADRNGDD